MSGFFRYQACLIFSGNIPLGLNLKVTNKTKGYAKLQV